MEKIVSQRDDFLDFLKGFLIILVVYGHVLQFFGYHDQTFFADPVFRAIYIFHMPLFMLISGYLAASTFGRYALFPFFSRKIRQLIVPILCWSVFLTLFEYLRYLRAPKPPTSIAPLLFLINTYLHEVAGIWFIWALFLGFITVFLARSAKKHQLVALIGLNGLILFVPNFLSLDYCKFVLPYFCVGYLAAQRSSEVRIPNIWYLLSLPASILIFLVWKPQFFIYISGMSLTATNIPIVIGRFIAGFVCSLAIYETLRRLYKRMPSSLLSFLGRHTLIIYIAQSFFMRLGTHMPATNRVVFYALLGPVLTFVVIYSILQMEKGLGGRVWARRGFLGQEPRPQAVTAIK